MLSLIFCEFFYRIISIAPIPPSHHCFVYFFFTFGLLTFSDGDVVATAVTVATGAAIDCCFRCFQIESNTHPMGIAEELFIELPETMGNGIS